MRKLIFLILLIGFSEKSKTQDQEDNSSRFLYEYNEFGLGGSAIYVEYPDLATRTGFGLNLHYAVQENILLNWHMYFGKRYFSTSVWVPLGPLLFAASVGSGNLSKGTLGLLLLSFLPDGVTFPIRLSNKLYITPTISPLNLDLFGKDLPKRFYINGNFALGIQLKGKYFNVHPYAAVNLLYSGAQVGFSGGLEVVLRMDSIRD